VSAFTNDDLKKAWELIKRFDGQTFINEGKAVEWLENAVAAALAEAREEGRLAGLEEAAKITEHGYDENRPSFANQIRAIK
jgi:hypothetical protein